MSTISSATSKIGNEYIDIKLKTKNRRIQNYIKMNSHNPTIEGSYLKTLQSASITLKISKYLPVIMEQFFSTTSVAVKYRKVFE